MHVYTHWLIPSALFLLWFREGLTFSHQVGPRGVTAPAVAGSAAVQTAVLLLHALNRQKVVVLTKNHA